MNNPPDQSDSVYNLADAQNMAKIASYYNFWIVLRYDGDNDLSTATTCWLNYWQTVIQQVGPLYDQIVWEPVNEPGASVSVLSADYQLWINMARSNGDKHFVAVENQCSSITGCPFWPNAQLGYPTVTDSLGKVLISYHPYHGWQYNSGSWNAAGAIAGAQADYQVMVLGEQNTGWYALNTEGGADPQVADCVGPPDCILPGSAGYTSVTLVYIQTLTHLLDSHVPRINWVWWPAASWTGTPCAGTYGALQPANCPRGSGYSGGVGWGTLLNYVPVSVLLPPALTVPGSQTVTAGLWLNFTVTAAPVNLGGSVSLSATGLPAGASFDPTTGAFSWKPGATQTGSYTIIFTATDNGEPSAPTSKPMTIQVQQAAPGSSRSCPLCGIFPVISSSVGLLIVGGLLGLIASLILLTIRARATLERTKRRTNQLSIEN